LFADIITLDHAAACSEIAMPIHDWTRVEAGIFHAFHHFWITEIARALNRGLLPADYYALPEQFAGGAKAVTVHRASNQYVVSVIELLLPGNKKSQNGLSAFVHYAHQALAAGVNLLMVDLFPPGRRDPQGIHSRLWKTDSHVEFRLPVDKPLTCASYIGGAGKEAYIEPVAVGDVLLDMPLFLTPDVYVPVPLEMTYQAAWAPMPGYWRNLLTADSTP
jgi:hypothetical protein